MSKVLDLTGHVYGRLTVLYQIPYAKSGTRWACKCVCGKLHDALSNALRRDKVRSCGCLHKETVTTHGETKTKLFVVWASMLQRCYNSKAQAYKNYGAIGVTVCSTWKNDFIAFRDWSNKNGYANGLSIDRIASANIYSPETCRWATSTIQLRNQRIKTGGSCEYVGVFHKNNGFESSISVNKKYVYLGRHKTGIDAAKHRDAYIKEHSLEGFTLNFP